MPQLLVSFKQMLFVTKHFTRVLSEMLDTLIQLKYRQEYHHIPSISPTQLPTRNPSTIRLKIPSHNPTTEGTELISIWSDPQRSLLG